MRYSIPRGFRATAKLAFGLALCSCSGTLDAPDDAGATGGSASSAGGAAGSTHSGGSAGASAGSSGTSGGSANAGSAGTGGNAGSAGSSTGGSAGTSSGGGGGIRVVGECDNLGAVDEFQDVTPAGLTETDYGVVTVSADPVYSGTLYIGTDHHGIHKSTNCGADWEKINTGANSAALDGGILYTVEVDPVDPDMIFASALYSSDSRLFRSTNGGVDFEPLWPTGSNVAETVEYVFFQALSFDPTNHQHLVVTFHANCKGDFAPSCLGESTDSGETWRLFKSPLSGWSEAAAPVVFGPTSWVLATGQNGIHYTSDSGATWENVGPGVYGPGHPYKALDGYYYAGSDYGLQRTIDGSDWESVPNTFQGRAVIGDGVRLFTNKSNESQPFYTAPETDGTTWTPLASPDAATIAEHFAYDPEHHLLYSIHRKSGVWRMVTQ